MKKLFLLLPAIFLTFAFGCSQSGQKTEAPQPAPAAQQAAPAQAPAAAPAQQPESAKEIVEGYGKGLVTSVDKARGAQASVDLGSVKDAVRNYQVENGRYPASLDAIKNYIRPEINLSAFNYDPATGNVTLK